MPDLADLQRFGNTQIALRAGGREQMMLRREALLNKMFEDAMKGKVSMQRFLYREFQKFDEQLARARLQYDRLVYEWIINNPDYGKAEGEIPPEIQNEIESLRRILNHYFPGSYGDYDED